jgi:hypothetical protein
MGDQTIELAKAFRSEFHFLKFPFFDLSSPDSKKDRIEITETKETKEGKIEILWRVSRGVDSNLPSSFAHKIHKYIVEKNINSLKKPIPRLIRVGSLYQICKNLKIVQSGENYEAIKKALKDITTASIEVKGTFRQKEKNGAKKFFNGVFHLYNMVFFTNEVLPDGTKADAAYVQLNDMYVQNINNNFVVPMNYEYYHTLSGNIPSRMYELLTIWFYPALENKKNYIQKEYSELCNYFPLIRQDCKWKAKKQLKVAHQQHVSSGFLACEPEWIDTSKKGDWLIKYHIGLKAKEWYFENNKLGYLNKEIKQLEELPSTEDKKTKEEKNNDINNQIKNNPITLKLINFGVTASVAENLVENYNSEFIEYWMLAINKKENIEDKAAFLVKAIKDSWGLPLEIKKTRQKAKEKEEERLMAEYNKFIIAKVDECLKEMKKEEMEKELEDYKEIFLKKCRYPEELKEIIRTNEPSSQIIYNYKFDKAEKLGLASFEKWRLETN